MGLSVSAASAIIGVAAVLSFGYIIGSVLPAVSNFIDSYDDMKDRAVNQIQSNINVSGLTTVAGASEHNVNISVENLGNIAHETNDFSILINGVNYDFTCTKSWLYPNCTAYFNIEDVPGKDGSRNLKILSDNGISDHYYYTLK